MTTRQEYTVTADANRPTRLTFVPCEHVEERGIYCGDTLSEQECAELLRQNEVLQKSINTLTASVQVLQGQINELAQSVKTKRIA